MKSLEILPALLLAACAMAAPIHASAQDWPTKPVRILVGSAPGGGTDAMARAVADRLGPLLKQPVVVENRPGVSNTLAADVTAKGLIQNDHAGKVHRRFVSLAPRKRLR